MRARTAPGVCILLTLLVIGGAAVAAPAGTFEKDIPRVTLKVQDATPQDALAEIEKTTGVQIAIPAEAKATVNAEVKDQPIEAALDTVVQAFQGSWMRYYLIEAEGPPQDRYTAEEIIKFLQAARDDYLKRMTPEQRDKLTANWQAMVRAATGQTEHKIGARIFRSGQTRTPGTEDMGPVDISSLLSTYDPLREVVSRGYTDKLTLDLKDVSLEAALDEVRGLSGFYVLADEDLKGAISLQLKDADVEQAIDQIATTLKAKWRRAYIVTKPRPQTQDEVYKRLDEGFDRGVAEFWSKSPDERKKIINDIAQRLQNLPPDVRQMAKSFPLGKRILTKVIQYNAGLGGAQRQEIGPAVREVARLFGGG
jgi:hypothetical protein